MSETIEHPAELEPVAPTKRSDATTKAQRDANEAQARADAAQAEVAAKLAQARAESQGRVDKAEAERPQWQVIHAGPMDSTERLVMPGGYLLRSTWRAIKGRQGADPLDGNSMVFVAGDPPALPNPLVMVLTVDDLQPGIDPENARLEDTHPIKQIPTTPEVLLMLPDGQVRVLKSRDPSAVGTVRAVMVTDGVVG